jgi:hypothetical protein
MRVLKTSADFHSVGTEIRINELKDYLDIVIKQLGIMAKEYSRNVDEQAKKIVDETEKDEFIEYSGEQYWDYTKTYPRILLNSFLVAAYSLLESEIYAVATFIGRKQKQLFDVTDFGGRDYLRIATNYISKVSGVKAQDFKTWNFVDDARQIRNIIVHSNGKLVNQHDFDLSKQYGLVNDSIFEFPSIRTTVFLSITHEYCHLFLKSMGEFFSELYTTAGKFL